MGQLFVYSSVFATDTFGKHRLDLLRAARPLSHPNSSSAFPYVSNVYSFCPSVMPSSVHGEGHKTLAGVQKQELLPLRGILN